MKKHPFLLALALLGGAARPAAAQRKTVVPLLPTDSFSQRISFRGAVPVPGVPAAELQARAREWVALTFEDAHQVVQLDDAARGVLVAQGCTATWVDRGLRPNGKAGQLSFALRLDFRDGRYRYEVSELGRPPPWRSCWRARGSTWPPPRQNGRASRAGDRAATKEPPLRGGSKMIKIRTMGWKPGALAAAWCPPRLNFGGTEKQLFSTLTNKIVCKLKY